MIKPKVIFICGAPGTGKTTLAIKLAERLGIDQVVSSDIVRAVLRSLSNESNDPLLFSVTHDSWKHFGGKNFENMWKGFIAHCNYLFPVFNSILDKSLSEGRSIIFEGSHITPSFLKKVGVDNTFSILLTVKDDSSLLERYALKNLPRTVSYSGWKNNFDVIRYIESKILDEKECFTKIIENKNLGEALNEILEVINEVSSNK